VLEVIAVVIGVALVLTALADMLNTLVTTQTSQARWWLTSQLYRRSWSLVRWVARRMSDERVADRMLGTFAPLSVLLLLTAWVVQQIVGFGLVWWGLGGVSGATSLADALYYSGVVYFTLGFGEVVPAELVPRFGALVEAFAGVLTTAMVIGYLPAMYSAYSERERKLMTLDAGTSERITPTALVISRSPSADPDELVAFFAGWEDWVAGVIETHTSFPMLMLFRSQHRGQNWVTALGLLSDAALQCQMIRGAENRAPYWMFRRSVRLFRMLTEGADLSEYRKRFDEVYTSDQESLWRDLYLELEAHGFDLLPQHVARVRTLELRREFDARLEFLIDELMAPRGFWGHDVALEGEGRDDSLPTIRPDTAD
jgi:hypothetical protein